MQAEQIKQRLGIICAAEEDIPIEAVIANMMTANCLTLGLAESCTGGYIAHKITNLPGSSRFFKGSIVSYSNEVKKSLLMVSDETLHTVGAVSEETVRQMAGKAREILDVDYALSVSGILGPSGATAEKPVGMIWMAIADKENTIAKVFYFRYDREGNKEMAVNYGLDWLRRTMLGQKTP
jgi:nicotinamide-nucleotide amidase